LLGLNAMTSAASFIIGQTWEGYMMVGCISGSWLIAEFAGNGKSKLSDNLKRVKDMLTSKEFIMPMLFVFSMQQVLSLRIILNQSVYYFPHAESVNASMVLACVQSSWISEERPLATGVVYATTLGAMIGKYELLGLYDVVQKVPDLTNVANGIVEDFDLSWDPVAVACVLINSYFAMNIITACWRTARMYVGGKAFFSAMQLCNVALVLLVGFGPFSRGVIYWITSSGDYHLTKTTDGIMVIVSAGGSAVMAYLAKLCEMQESGETDEDDEENGVQFGANL